MKNLINRKLACDLISLVATAVATDTIAEAEDYIVEHYQGVNDMMLEHTLNVLTKIKNKQQNEGLEYLND